MLATDFDLLGQFLRKILPKFEPKKEQLSDHGSKLSNYLELGLGRSSAKNQQTNLYSMRLEMAECEGKR